MRQRIELKHWKRAIVVVLVLPVAVIAIGFLAIALLVTVEPSSDPDLPSVVEVRIDPDLDPSAALPMDAGSSPELELHARAELSEDGGVRLNVFRAVREEHYERLTLVFASPGSSSLATATALWYEESDRRSGWVEGRAKGIHGSVILSAAMPPTPDHSRVITYDLRGTRDGRPCSFRGTLRLHASDLRRR